MAEYLELAKIDSEIYLTRSKIDFHNLKHFNKPMDMVNCQLMKLPYYDFSLVEIMQLYDYPSKTTYIYVINICIYILPLSPKKLDKGFALVVLAVF